MQPVPRACADEACAEWSRGGASRRFAEMQAAPPTATATFAALCGSGTLAERRTATFAEPVALQAATVPNHRLAVAVYAIYAG